jgi:integrase
MAQKVASDVLPDVSGVLPADGPGKAASSSKRVPATIPITKVSLRRLTCPQGKAEAFYWDDQVPGLGLRAYSSGKRVWLLQYRDAGGRTRRIGLGDVNALDPEKAREAARAHLTQKAVGSDPAAKRRADRQAMRVGELVASYLDHLGRHARPSTLDQSRRNLNKYAEPLREEALTAVDRAAIHRLHKRLTSSAGPVQANRTLATLSAMFAWGMRAGLAKDNPASLVPKNPETPKDRVLSDDELRLIWRATATGGDYDRIVRLLMLTGCRREEIGGLRWSEVNGSLVTIPANRTKSGIVHGVPLSHLAHEQLPERREGRDPVFGSGQGGFSGWSRSKARLDGTIARLRYSALAQAPADDNRIASYALPPWGCTTSAERSRRV